MKRGKKNIKNEKEILAKNTTNYNSVQLGNIEHNVEMYTKSVIDDIKDNIITDYTSKINEINFTLTDTCEKLNEISVDLSDDISNIIELRQKIAKDIENLEELKADIEDDISNVININIISSDLYELSNSISNKVPEYEQDPVFNVWKNSENVIAGKDSNAVNSSIAIGLEAYSAANAHRTVVIGHRAISKGSDSVVVGKNAIVSQRYGTAVGFGAKVDATEAIQLGEGTNVLSGSLQFKNYPLVNSDGYIFEDRIPNRIIKLVDDLSDMTDLSNGTQIVETLINKIDSEISILSNSLINEFDNKIEELNNDVNVSDNILNELIMDLSDELSLEIKTINSNISSINNINKVLESSIIELNDRQNNLETTHVLDISELYSNIFNLSDDTNLVLSDLSNEISNLNLIISDLSNVLSNEIFVLNSKIDELSNNLSNEVFVLNSKIDELSNNLSNEVFILNSKIDELSNNLENSINESINNMIIDEVIEDSDSLVKSSGIFKALQKDFVKIDLSANETIPLKNNTVYSITTDSNQITPNLQFPITGNGSDEILISIRSEDSSGVKYDIDDSEDRAALIYTQNGILNFDHSGDSYATIIKGEFDGLFWYVHDHVYKRVIDNKLTIIFSGVNQQNGHTLKNYKESFSVNANTEGKFIFKFDNLTTISYNDTTKTLNSKWNSLYNNNTCKLLGWTMTETFAGTNPQYKAGKTFTYDTSYSGKIITFYPIYEIVEINITDQSVSKNVKGSKTVNGVIDLRNSSIFGTNTDFIFNAKTKWQIYAGNSGTCFLKANWNGQTLVDLFYQGANAKTTYTDINNEYLYFASTSSNDNKRQLDMNCGYTSADKGGIFTITVYSIKVGYNKYNKPDFNSVRASW